MTAIIVEDNEANFLLVRETLTPLGWKVIQVSRCADLRPALKAQPHDLIVMDISLPDGDGIALTRELRESGCRVPIVVMSAHAFSEIKGRALDAGADAFFPKPFDLAELEKIVSGFSYLVQAPASSEGRSHRSF